MGTFIEERLKGSMYGESIYLDYVIYTDILHDDGDVHISIYLVSQPNNTFEFCILYRDFDEKWIRGFWSAYQHDKDFRDKALEYYAKEEFKPHKTISIVLDEKKVRIDEELAPAILKLNHYGYKTRFCCQGGSRSTAYLVADLLPDNLLQILNQAKFSVTKSSTYAHAPFSQPKYVTLANQKFCEILNDWANDRLKDPSEYQWKPSSWPKTLIQLPKIQQPDQKKTLEEQIKILLRKNNQGKAYFKDFSSLKSGSDKYSLLKLDALLCECHLDHVPHEIACNPEGQQLKTLRWICRGLPIELAIRKVATDLGISINRKHHS